MQEAELRECAERIFVEALVRTYQRDVLIDLYHALREIWHKLAQPCDRPTYIIRLGEALQQIRSVDLLNCQNGQSAEADRALVQRIENQLAQLEEQAHF